MLLVPKTSYAQKSEIVQYSGFVKNELLKALPYANIFIKNKKKMTYSDSKGMFSFIVAPGDTVIFSCIGYKKKELIIPDTIKNSFYNLDVVLKEDTMKIKPVTIYPWKNYEEFKQAVIDLKLPETDMDRAMKNIAIIRTQVYMVLKPEASVNYKNVMQQEYTKAMNYGLAPTISLLNPFAWGKFIEAIKNGDFSNDKQNNK
jgi:hypothetical protein